MRLKTARTIATISLLLSTHYFAAAETVSQPPSESPIPVDPRVSLRLGENTQNIDAVNRQSALAADEQAVTPEQLAQQETVRRQEFVFTANKAIFDGDRLRAAGELEAAAKRYEFALSHLSPGGQMAFLYQRASTSLASIKAVWAENAMKKNNYEEAARLYQEAARLDPNHESYQSELVRARRKQHETTGAPLPPSEHRRNRIVVPATRTGAEDNDNNLLPPLKSPPATINTRNHIADPTDLLN